MYFNDGHRTLRISHHIPLYDLASGGLCRLLVDDEPTWLVAGCPLRLLGCPTGLRRVARQKRSCGTVIVVAVANCDNGGFVRINLYVIIIRPGKGAGSVQSLVKG